MVHASCYGNPLSKQIPEGDWFCERCRFIKNDTDLIHCSLCPKTEGAMKQTIDGKWAHLVCALLVPEVFFVDPEGRDGIDCSKVPKKRWLEKCYVCDCCDGCALVCSEPKCGLGFHITCGIKEDLCIEYKEGKKGSTVVAGFCKSHSQLWEKVTSFFDHFFKIYNCYI
jgi:NuA3 HAT complex component NTO1